MTTTNTRFCDPNAAAGGNGTTNALSGGNCAYASLNVWEAARQADLPTGDIIEKVICSSDDAGSTHLEDTTAFTIDGWTTDATRYIQIESASSHGGIWDDTIYRTKRASGYHITIAEDYVNVIGIQMKAESAGAAARCVATAAVASGTRVINFRKCIFRGVYSGTHQYGYGFYLAGTGATETWNMDNCLFYDFTGGYGNNKAIYINNVANTTVNARNCTFHSCDQSINRTTAGTANATNCGFVSAGTSGTVSQTTCSSSTPTFVNEAGDNFHLASNDTTWHDQGTDLSATFTDDIDGETRVTWDIGCDEYVAAATAFPWFLDYTGGLNYDMAGGL